MIRHTLTFYAGIFTSKYPIRTCIKLPILDEEECSTTKYCGKCNICEQQTTTKLRAYFRCTDNYAYKALYCQDCYNINIKDYKRVILQTVLFFNTHLIPDITRFIFAYLLV